MLNNVKRDTFMKKIKMLPLIGALVMAMSSLVSCEDSFIFDDRSECYSGVNLRFIYDYHMEPGANSFPVNVDCVTVFVFDTEGNYIKHISETSDALRSEGYRMNIPLEEGDYELIAWGGLTCEKATFDLTPDWLTRAGDTRNDMFVSLPLTDGISKKKLHDIEERSGGLFYGSIPLTIGEDDWAVPGQMRTVTMPVIKDTNNIQVILQELSVPDQVDYNDFDFKIIDDNFILNADNQPVSVVIEDNQPLYEPYAAENRHMGYTQAGVNNGDPSSTDRTKEVQVACAEFSTSRLLFEHLESARLVVTSKELKDDNGNDKVVIDIPLIKYLAATRGFGLNWIKDDPEFLDRQSNWTLIFFLQRNEWVKARVVVNDWTVRTYNIEL